jgi:hypothetical protein
VEKEMSQHTNYSHQLPNYPARTGETFRASPPLIALPEEIVCDPNLNPDEKREMLASWLSDIRAVPDAPAWRQLDNGTFVRVDEVSHALRVLDGSPASSEQAPGKPPFPRRRRSTRWIGNVIRRRRRDDEDDDPPPVPVSSRRPPSGLPPIGQEEAFLLLAA